MTKSAKLLALILFLCVLMANLSPGLAVAQERRLEIAELTTNFASVRLIPVGAGSGSFETIIVSAYVNGSTEWPSSSTMFERSSEMLVYEKPWSEVVTELTQVSGAARAVQLSTAPVEVTNTNSSGETTKAVLVVSATEGTVQALTSSMNQTLDPPLPESAVAQSNIHIYHKVHELYQLVESLDPSGGCMVLKVSEQVRITGVFPRDPQYNYDRMATVMAAAQNTSHDRGVLGAGRVLLVNVGRRLNLPDTSSYAPRPEDFGELAGQQISSGVGFNDLWGSVMVWETADWDDSFSAAPGVDLYIESVIVTGPDSGAILSLRDNTIFYMGPNSIIRIGDQRDEKSRFELLTGHVMTNVKQMLKDGSMDIQMSQGVSGIKGTIFVLDEDGSSSRVKVLEGEVELTPTRGEPVRLVGGQTAEATGLGTSVGTFAITSELARWPESVRQEITGELAERGVDLSSKSGGQMSFWLLAVGSVLLLAAPGGFVFIRRR